METNSKTNYLAKKIVSSLTNKHLKIAFAESMTGGLLASEIISVANASKVIEESYIVYSNKAKQTVLKCKKETIDKFSVYSFEVVKEMVTGLQELSDANILVGVSGNAGPTVNSGNKIGEIFIGIAFNDKYYSYKLNLSGNRNQIRQKCVDEIFEIIIKLL
ncbi:MAG: CinA family protein [Candidatus Izimaplasma sp.]|nr:CinA family protein [Candidatus Izimaplasma bacterium]